MRNKKKKKSTANTWNYQFQLQTSKQTNYKKNEDSRGWFSKFHLVCIQAKPCPMVTCRCHIINIKWVIISHIQHHTNRLKVTTCLSPIGDKLKNPQNREDVIYIRKGVNHPFLKTWDSFTFSSNSSHKSYLSLLPYILQIPCLNA